MANSAPAFVRKSPGFTKLACPSSLLERNEGIRLPGAVSKTPEPSRRSPSRFQKLNSPPANPRDGRARGFDSIVDLPNFAGGLFSFWNREGLRLLGSGVLLTAPCSLIPSLRSSKEEGQANFVNPGLFLTNAGAEFAITPK